MQLSLAIAALALAFTASAAPATAVPAGDIDSTGPDNSTVIDPDSSDSDVNDAAAKVSGYNTPGSIFRFGSASACRQILWQGGACGLSTYFANKVDPNMPLIAFPSRIFDKYGSAQHNSLCARVITMTYKGVTRRAVVADENTSNEQSIDMCLDMWQAFGGRDNDGTIIKPFTWSIA